MSGFGATISNSHTTKLVLYNLLNNKRFFYDVIDAMETRFFDGCYELSAIIGIITEHYRDTQEQIGNYTLLAKIDQKYGSGNGHSDIIKYLESVTAVDELADVKTLSDMLIDIVKRNLLLNKSMDIAKMMKNPEDHRINEVINSMGDIMTITFSQSNYDDFMPETAEELLEEMNTEDLRIPFKLTALNEATDGGVMRGTLNTIIGGTGAGKTLTMLSLMIDYLELGFNCAYISLELGANMIKPRFRANVMDIPLGDLNNYKYSRLTDEEITASFNNPFKRIRGKSTLKTAEPNSYTARDIERYIIGYEKIHNVKIDVVFIDHLSLMPTYGGFTDQTMASKYGQSQAEEAITMAKRLDLACWTGAQFNRGSMTGVDGDMTGIAGSIGVTHASDLVISIHADEEVGALLFKKHKCRYSDVSVHNRGHIGIDRGKQRLYDYDGRKYNMTEFDAKLEEKNRANSENNVYIPTQALEAIINTPELSSADIDKLAKGIGEGMFEEDGELILIPKTNKVEEKKEKKPIIIEFG